VCDDRDIEEEDAAHMAFEATRLAKEAAKKKRRSSVVE
jgi:hypothetical protein